MRSDAADEFFCDLAGKIEAEFGFTCFFVRAVAVEAVFRKDRAHVTIEIDSAGGGDSGEE